MDSMHVSVVRRNLRVDGVKCELTALRINEGFQALWQCPSRNVGGSSLITFAHSTAALEWAEGCARSHFQHDACPQSEATCTPLSA